MPDRAARPGVIRTVSRWTRRSRTCCDAWRMLLSGRGTRPQGPSVDGRQPLHELPRETPGYDELRSSGEERLRRKLEGRRDRGDRMELESGNDGADQTGDCRRHRRRNRAGHLGARQLAAHAAVESHGHRPQEEPDRHQYNPHDQPLIHVEPTLGDARSPVKDSAHRIPPPTILESRHPRPRTAPGGHARRCSRPFQSNVMPWPGRSEAMARPSTSCRGWVM